MASQTMMPNIATLGVKWIARIASLLSISIILLFLGDFHPLQVRPREWVGFIFFPIGIVIGMLIAWWKEWLGGSITTASLLAFYLIYGLLLGSNIHGWAFVVFAAPGFVFLFYSIIPKNNPRKRTS